MKQRFLALVFTCCLIATINAAVCTVGTGIACRTCSCSDTNDVCLKCNNGYYLETAAAPICSVCTGTGCLVCAATAGATSYCSITAQGYWPNAGVSTACNPLTSAGAAATGSLWCTSGTDQWATKCTAGNTVSNCAKYSTCVATGTTGNVCSTCMAGYFRDVEGLTCTVCTNVANCLLTSPYGHTCPTAATNAICTTCKVGFWGSGTDTCTACFFTGCPSTGQVTCTSAFNAVCSYCPAGYYSRSPNQDCDNCSIAPNCCGGADFTFTCTGSGFPQTFYSCSQTSVTNIGCNQFNYCGINRSPVCTSCHDGYFFTAGADIDTTGTCTACSTTTGNAVMCKTGKVTCTSTTITCLECKDTFILAAGACTSCTDSLPNCAVANQVCQTKASSPPTYCTSCKTTTAGVYNQPNCARHSACNVCSALLTTPSVCSKCNDGYYLDGSSCVACPTSTDTAYTGCMITCDSYTSLICSGCNNGYALSTATGLCVVNSATTNTTNTTITNKTTNTTNTTKTCNSYILFLSLSVILAFLALLI